MIFIFFILIFEVSCHQLSFIIVFLDYSFTEYWAIYLCAVLLSTFCNWICSSPCWNLGFWFMIHVFQVIQDIKGRLAAVLIQPFVHCVKFIWCSVRLFMIKIVNRFNIVMCCKCLSMKKKWMEISDNKHAVTVWLEGQVSINYTIGNIYIYIYIYKI